MAIRIGGDSVGDGVGPGYPPLVMEFFEGAEEIGDVDVDEGIVDEGLSLIRKLWDAGGLLGQFRARAPERRPISGWSCGGGVIHSGEASFSLNSDRAGMRAVR